MASASDQRRAARQEAGGISLTMSYCDLQEELLSTLAGLQGDLPTDLIDVQLDLSGGEGCRRCRFAKYIGGEADCRCQTAADDEGLDALATSPVLMTMTLSVRARATGVTAPIYIGYGWNQEEGDPPENGHLMIAAPDRGSCFPVFERWGAGFFRRFLITAIFDVAVLCGCSVLETDRRGHYVRTDTNEPLFNCCIDDMFDDETSGPDSEESAVSVPS